MTKEEFDVLWSICFGGGTPDNNAKYIIQDETELWELCQRLAKLNPQKGLEIGNGHGGTTLFWQALAPLVVSLDLYGVGSKNGVFPVEMLDDVKFIDWKQPHD